MPDEKRENQNEINQNLLTPATAAEQDPWGFGVWPALGAFWVLLLLLLAEVALLFGTYANQSYIFGLLSVVVFFAVLHVGGRLHFIQTVFKRPLRSLLVLAIYVALGMGWICGYWTVESRKAARVAMEDKIAWMRSQGLEGTTVPESHLKQWREHVSANPKVYSIPRWYEHKGDLAWRGLFWPVSILHTFLADIVYEFYLWIVEAFGNFLDQISRWMFKDVLQELNPPAAPATK